MEVSGFKGCGEFGNRNILQRRVPSGRSKSVLHVPDSNAPKGRAFSGKGDQPLRAYELHLRDDAVDCDISYIADGWDPASPVRVQTQSMDITAPDVRPRHIKKLAMCIQWKPNPEMVPNIGKCTKGV